MKLLSVVLVAAALSAACVGGIKLPPIVIGTPPTTQPPVEPSLPPPPPDVGTPSPAPSASPSAVPTAVPPPPPPPPCVVPGPPAPCELPPPDKRECSTCAERLEYEVRHGNLTWDPRRKLYFNTHATGTDYFDRQCNKTSPEGVVRMTGYEWFGIYPENGHGLCPPPVCPPPTIPAPCTPAPPPPPPPPGGECVPPPLTENGNYPVPAAGTCPCWFKDALVRVGISVPNANTGGTPCGDGSYCRRFTLWATQKSAGKYCEHRCYDEEGRYFPGACKDMRECELFPGCQEPQFVDYVNVDDEGRGGGVLIQIMSDAFEPPWNTTWGRADKQTCTPGDRCPPGMANPVHNFNAHDKAVDRPGWTRARACMPDGTKCSETSYRTDGRQ